MRWRPDVLIETPPPPTASSRGCVALVSVFA